MSNQNLEDFICDGGTPVGCCELCGRIHFATYSTEGIYKPGELEDYEQRHEKEPDKYIPRRDSSSVSIGYFDGKNIVWGCECKGILKYERFILQHADIIIDFIKARATIKRDEAQRILDKASK